MTNIINTWIKTAVHDESKRDYIINGKRMKLRGLVALLEAHGTTIKGNTLYSRCNASGDLLKALQTPVNHAHGSKASKRPDNNPLGLQTTNHGPTLDHQTRALISARWR